MATKSKKNNLKRKNNKSLKKYNKKQKLSKVIAGKKNKKSKNLKKKQKGGGFYEPGKNYPIWAKVYDDDLKRDWKWYRAVYFDNQGVPQNPGNHRIYFQDDIKSRTKYEPGTENPLILFKGRKRTADKTQYEPLHSFHDTNLSNNKPKNTESEIIPTNQDGRSPGSTQVAPLDYVDPREEGEAIRARTGKSLMKDMFSNNKTRRRVGPEPEKGTVAVSKNNNTRKKMMEKMKADLNAKRMNNATVVPGTKEQEEEGREDPFGFLDNQTVDSQAQQQGEYKSPKVIPLNDGNSVTSPLHKKPPKKDALRILQQSAKEVQQEEDENTKRILGELPDNEDIKKDAEELARQIVEEKSEKENKATRLAFVDKASEPEPQDETVLSDSSSDVEIIQEGSKLDEESVEDFEDFEDIEEIKKYLEDSRQSMGNQFPLLSEAYKNKENIKNMNEEKLLKLEELLRESQDELEKLEAEHEKIKIKINNYMEKLGSTDKDKNELETLERYISNNYDWDQYKINDLKNLIKERKKSLTKEKESDYLKLKSGLEKLNNEVEEIDEEINGMITGMLAGVEEMSFIDLIQAETDIIEERKVYEHKLDLFNDFDEKFKNFSDVSDDDKIGTLLQSTAATLKSIDKKYSDLLEKIEKKREKHGQEYIKLLFEKMDENYVCTDQLCQQFRDVYKNKEKIENMNEEELLKLEELLRESGYKFEKIKKARDEDKLASALEREITRLKEWANITQEQENNIRKKNKELLELDDIYSQNVANLEEKIKDRRNVLKKESEFFEAEEKEVTEKLAEVKSDDKITELLNYSDSKDEIIFDNVAEYKRAVAAVADAKTSLDNLYNNIEEKRCNEFKEKCRKGELREDKKIGDLYNKLDNIGERLREPPVAESKEPEPRKIGPNPEFLHNRNKIVPEAKQAAYQLSYIIHKYNANKNYHTKGFENLNSESTIVNYLKEFLNINENIIGLKKNDKGEWIVQEKFAMKKSAIIVNGEEKKRRLEPSGKIGPSRYIDYKSIRNNQEIYDQWSIGDYSNKDYFEQKIDVEGILNQAILYSDNKGSQTQNFSTLYNKFKDIHNELKEKEKEEYTKVPEKEDIDKLKHFGLIDHEEDTSIGSQQKLALGDNVGDEFRKETAEQHVGNNVRHGDDENGTGAHPLKDDFNSLDENERVKAKIEDDEKYAERKREDDEKRTAEIERENKKNEKEMLQQKINAAIENLKLNPMDVGFDFDRDYTETLKPEELNFAMALLEEWKNKHGEDEHYKEWIQQLEKGKEAKIAAEIKAREQATAKQRAEEEERKQREEEERKQKETAELKAKQEEEERIQKEAAELKAKQEEEERIQKEEQDKRIEEERIQNEKEAAELKAMQDEEERIQKELEDANKLPTPPSNEKDKTVLPPPPGDDVESDDYVNKYNKLVLSIINNDENDELFNDLKKKEGELKKMIELSVDSFILKLKALNIDNESIILTNIFKQPSKEDGNAYYIKYLIQETITHVSNLGYEAHDSYENFKEFIIKTNRLLELNLDIDEDDIKNYNNNYIFIKRPNSPMEKGDLDSKIKGISQIFKESGINKNLIDSLSTKIRKKLKEDNVKDMRDSFKSKTPKGLENPNDSGSESLSDDESSDDEYMEPAKKEAAKVKVKEMQEKAKRYKRTQEEGFKVGDEVTYKGTDEDEVVTVVGRHMDDYPNIYYTIQFSDKSEKQTVPEKLSSNVEEEPFSSDSDEEVTGGKVKGGKNRTQKRGKKRLNRTLKN